LLWDGNVAQLKSASFFNLSAKSNIYQQSISPTIVSKTTSKAAPGRTTDSKKAPPCKTPSVTPKPGVSAGAPGSIKASKLKVQSKLNLTPSPQMGNKAPMPSTVAKVSSSPMPGFFYAVAASSPPCKVPSPSAQVVVKKASAESVVVMKAKLSTSGKLTTNDKAAPPYIPLTLCPVP
jgi:hypothetical protein